MSFSIETFFIQILHDTNRNHWLTVSNFGSNKPENVYKYNSLFSMAQIHN